MAPHHDLSTILQVGHCAWKASDCSWCDADDGGPGIELPRLAQSCHLCWAEHVRFSSSAVPSEPSSNRRNTGCPEILKRSPPLPPTTSSFQSYFNIFGAADLLDQVIGHSLLKRICPHDQDYLLGESSKMNCCLPG